MNVRAEISKRNKYWISKHRYYELKHYCLQYSEWKKIYAALDQEGIAPHKMSEIQNGNIISDITSDIAIAKLYYSEKIKMIEEIAKESDEDLWAYILIAVTEEKSYNYLKTKLDIPCGKDMHYDRYRKFFWLLNKRRK